MKIGSPSHHRRGGLEAGLATMHVVGGVFVLGQDRQIRRQVDAAGGEKKVAAVAAGGVLSPQDRLLNAEAGRKKSLPPAF